MAIVVSVRTVQPQASGDKLGHLHLSAMVFPLRLTRTSGCTRMGFQTHMRELQHSRRLPESSHGVVVYYSGWPEPFQVGFAKTAANEGAVPLVQMNPTHINIAAIAAGQYDNYLSTYAKAVRAYHHQVILSFGHEMNGYWYSWGYTHTSPAVFVAAWRHIVTLFRTLRAQNVTWLWTINTIHKHAKVPSPGPWWPGNSYVNWVGIDGYFTNSSSVFASVFGPTIVYVRSIDARSDTHRRDIRDAQSLASQRRSPICSQGSTSMACLDSYGSIPLTKWTGVSAAPQPSPRSDGPPKYTTRLHHEQQISTYHTKITKVGINWSLTGLGSNLAVCIIAFRQRKSSQTSGASVRSPNSPFIHDLPTTIRVSLHDAKSRTDRPNVYHPKGWKRLTST